MQVERARVYMLLADSTNILVDLGIAALNCWTYMGLTMVDNLEYMQLGH
jgi:hypothetical protein